MTKGELVYYKSKHQLDHEDQAVIVCGSPRKDGTIKVALCSHDGKITYQLVPVNSLRQPNHEDVYGYPHQQSYKGD